MKKIPTQSLAKNKRKPKRESSFQAECLEFCNKYGLLVLNVHQAGWTGKGFPDLLLCLKGKYVAIELKTPIGELGQDQKIWRNRIQKAQGIYACATKMHEFIEVVTNANEGLTLPDTN